ncbi:MAG TPA: hypothetical protein VLT56_11670, partial [Desulfobacterales bacterium]|nr:hypothetical protein [Desulfobacterales bacterium]
MAKVEDLYWGLPFLQIASSLVLYSFVDFMSAADDIKAFGTRHQFQRNFKGADDIKRGEMRGDAAVFSRHIDPLRQVQGNDGDAGKEIPAILERKFQGFRVHGDYQV